MTDYLDENAFFENWILYMLYYDRIDTNKGIDPAKRNNSKERMIFHYYFLFMDSNFKIIYAMVVMI